MAGSARGSLPHGSKSQSALARRATIAAVLFVLAVPANALAAGPTLGASFGPLAVIGLLLVGGGLVFLFGPDLINRRGSSAGERPGETAKDKQAVSDRGAKIEAQGGDGPPAEQPATGQQAANTSSAASRPPKQAAPRPAAAATSTDERPTLGGVFGAETCAEYAGGLTDQVLGRSKLFFASLASEGEIDSGLLAERLGAQPTELAGLLLTPLTRRAEAISVPAPFGLGRVKGTRRRLWLDVDGVASRLETAISREIAARAGSGSGPPGNGAGKAADRGAVAEDLATMRATGS